MGGRKEIMSAVAVDTTPSLSRRAAGRSGAIATANPLATKAGHDVLAEGGNAMDAVIAAAAVLGVVQPMMSGLGGDTFMLWRCGRSGRIHSVNGSGPAPLALDPQHFRAQGLARLPDRGMLSASVPGAVDAMCLALERFGSGRHLLARLLAPAIAHAEGGAPVYPSVARFLAANAGLLAGSESARSVFLPTGEPPRTGEVLRQPDLARTLRRLAEGGRDAFYLGEFARALVRHSEACGGAFTLPDLASFRAEIVDAISVAWGERTVFTNPPVGQGIVLLEAAGILSRLPSLANGRDPVVQNHRMIEAMKLAFADRNRFIGDPRFVDNPVDRLLGDAHLAARAAAVSDASAADAADVARMSFGDGDTTCLAAADAHGNIAACITSLSTPFGSAEVVPGTGVLMNNRAGRGFTLDASMPNCLAPGKRTVSTLHCYIVCDSSGPVLAGGTSGGDGQPQWNLQILDGILNEGLDPLAAIDRPRWELAPGTDPASWGRPYELKFDARFDKDIRGGLAGRGHAASETPLGMLGAAQVIAFGRDGTIEAAADGRADGCAMALD
jgi:gamma-glutamyltranspeptidase/glutathione hydrolase